MILIFFLCIILILLLIVRPHFDVVPLFSGETWLIVWYTNISKRERKYIPLICFNANDEE